MILLALLFLFWITRDILTARTAERRVAYSDLVAAVNGDQVSEAEIGDDEIEATLKPKDGKAPERVLVDRLPEVQDAALLTALEQHGVKVSGRPGSHGAWWAAAAGVLPFALLLALPWLLGMGGMAGARSRPMSFARSRAKLYDRSAENAVTFADVAGVDEAKGELTELVRFLKEPARYRALGARVPKGVLLVGAPGTGKTLLARAVAGESGVPFFTLSGSEFVEMFVGVGASRVRDLFVQAKERAPCIVFIDELDAIGKARTGNTGFAVNEEREQTLNQLLVEMDGFDSGEGLVIMAATNRPEVLDPALLRAGRFDRQVVVDRPDVRGREAILAVHAKKVKLGPDVDLKVVAQRTPGMVGADLANVVNEAALASVRRGGEHVDPVDFEEAIDRLQLGLKKQGRVMSDAEKRRVAFHESGHALVALTVEHADPVHRVSILPRTIGALGTTLQLPTQERYLLTREELRDRLCVLLGGRAAEETACSDVSTGAENDLEQATEMARQMVTRFGMSAKLGLAAYEHRGMRFLPGSSIGDDRVSDETARMVDEEVRALLDDAHARARRILEDRRGVLERVATALLEAETLDRAALERIARADSGPVAVAS